MKWEQTALEANELVSRVTDLPRGIVPEGTKWLTAAVDVGKYLLHWIVVAWRDSASGHIADYGRIEVASDSLGFEQAILVALKELRDEMLPGWPLGQVGGQSCQPHQVWIDAGYMTDVINGFCREQGDRFRPAIGRGAGQQHRQWYNRPTQTGAIVKHIGEGFHINLLQAQKIYLVEVNSDHWKTWAHQRLSTPVNQPGAMSLFQASPQEHLALAKHLTAEKKVEEFVAGKGVVVKWERIRRQNHWFDALYNACAAGYFCGVRLVGESQTEAPRPVRPRVQHRIRRPDGRPWIDVEGCRERAARYLAR